MAHFAQLDADYRVLQVLVVNNAVIIDGSGQENEDLGITFCQTLFPGTTWRQTSYNACFRKNYAGIGYTYDAARDAFIPPKPYNSWTLDEATCTWAPPISYPNDGKNYVWNEDIQSWDLVS